jgi:hypothetical protein
LDESDYLLSIFIAMNPVGLLAQILKCDKFPHVYENDNIFNNLLMQEKIGRPEVKGTKLSSSCFSAPVVESSAELGSTQ